jgi:hypothetical protein
MCMDVTEIHPFYNILIVLIISDISNVWSFPDILLLLTSNVFSTLVREHTLYYSNQITFIETCLKNQIYNDLKIIQVCLYECVIYAYKKCTSHSHWVYDLQISVCQVD